MYKPYATTLHYSYHLSFAVFLTVCLMACETDNFEQEDLTSQPQSTAIQVLNGMFVFSDESTFSETLTIINGMSESEYELFLSSYSITTYKSIFDQVVKAEWGVSDHYEALAAQGQKVPKEPVLSQEYRDALHQGTIQLIQDDEGGYFDYNLYEINMASLINTKGLVQIGKKIYQFGPKNKKIIENGDASLIDRLDQVEYTQKNVTVVHYFKDSNPNGRQFGRHEWLYANASGNNWAVYSKRRFRFYLQGSSYVDDTYGQRLYVTNVLRLEGQKKNFWGNWKYNESYSTNGTVSWQYSFGYDGSQNLPFGGQTPPTSSSPFSWQYPNASYNYGVNNAYFNLAPHFSGYYSFPPIYDCGDTGLCGALTDGVRLTNVNGNCTIYGKALDLDVVVTNN